MVLLPPIQRVVVDPLSSRERTKPSSSNGPKVKAGDRVLLIIPESRNFSYQYVLLTVVDPSG